MDALPRGSEPRTVELEALIEDTRRRLADVGRSLERAKALMEGIVERLDRSEERFARFRANRLSCVIAGSVERDRTLLHIESEDVLERTMAREIERRVEEGWAVTSITYDPRGATRVEIGFERTAHRRGNTNEG